MGKGFFKVHSAIGCTEIIVMSDALWSILMELHEGNSIVECSRWLYHNCYFKEVDIVGEPVTKS